MNDHPPQVRATAIFPVPIALLVGVVGLAICGGGFAINHTQFFRSYLAAYLFWAAIPIGCLGILLIHANTGGRWGLALQRILEAATETFPLMALLFLPILLGLHDIYLWADPEHVAKDPLLQKKAPYLNMTFFMVRVGIYFAIWIGVSFLLNHWSSTSKREYDLVNNRRRQVFSGPALALVGLAVTFAAIDWVMSLEPHWFSSIFGALMGASQVLPSLAFAIIVLILLARRTYVGETVGPGIYNDLGNLLLAFVMVWAYLSYSQFFLIWSGNLPEETTWYLHRIQGGWEWVAWLLVIFYFAFPFVMLFSRDNKRNPDRLVWIAGIVVFMHLVYQHWLVTPSFGAHGHGAPSQGGEHHGGHLHWMDLPALVGIGGIWLAFFFWRLPARMLLPLNDPALHEEAAHHA